MEDFGDIVRALRTSIVTALMTLGVDKTIKLLASCVRSTVLRAVRGVAKAVVTVVTGGKGPVLPVHSPRASRATIAKAFSAVTPKLTAAAGLTPLTARTIAALGHLVFQVAAAIFRGLAASVKAVYGVATSPIRLCSLAVVHPFKGTRRTGVELDLESGLNTSEPLTLEIQLINASAALREAQKEAALPGVQHLTPATMWPEQPPTYLPPPSVQLPTAFSMRKSAITISFENSGPTIPEAPNVYYTLSDHHGNVEPMWERARSMSRCVVPRKGPAQSSPRQGYMPVIEEGSETIKSFSGATASANGSAAAGDGSSCDGDSMPVSVCTAHWQAERNPFGASAIV